MAGMIEIAPDTRWSAAGWLFRWTVGYLADHAADPNVAESLREIVDEHLGWVGLGEFGPDARANLAAILRDIDSIADRTLPADIPNRTAVIAHLRELAQKAAS